MFCTTAINTSTPHLLKVEVFEVEMYFDDASGFDTCPQYVLLGRHVVFGAKTIQVVQKTAQHTHDEAVVDSRLRPDAAPWSVALSTRPICVAYYGRYATLSVNSLKQTVHTHCASVHQAAELVAALLKVAGVTAGLAESNGSLPPGL